MTRDRYGFLRRVMPPISGLITVGLLDIASTLLLSMPTYAQPTPVQPSQVSGVYQVDSLANLYWITQNPSSWSSSFAQTADIDASSDSTWNSGAGFPGFPPNPSAGQIFEGQYDGQGHTISGLYMSQSGSSQIGMFGEIYNGTVKNLGLINVRVTGSAQVGGLVGVSEYGTIDSCYTTGSVSGSVGVGGLVGAQLGGTVSYCHSSAAVSGVNGNVGGLVGKSAEYDPTNNLGNSTISNSYASGDVSGTASAAGGLVGYNEQTSQVSNCYATGNVTGGAFVGGLVGENYDRATVQGSYSTGRVSGTNTVGGFVGSNTADATITTCHSTGNVISSGGVSGGFAGENSPDQNSGVASYIATSYSTGIDSASGTDDNGGFAGINSNSEINQCYSSGGVFGRSYVGGLVGNFNQQLAESGIEIINSYSAASVNATGDYVGGLIGEVEGDVGNVAQVTVIYCYSGGKVTASDTSTGVGGLVGYNDGYSTSHCYWDTVTSGQATSGSGDIGESTTAMKTQSTYSGWDFTNTWTISSGANDGYPYLQSAHDFSLAVQATDFAASADGGSVILTWKTESELNNAGFNVLKQRSGIGNWQLVGSYTGDDSLRGLGTSSTGKTYDFTDDKVTSGDTYAYKIQSVSTNGTTKDLSILTVTVDVPKTYALYQNYPNPFNPSTTIRFDLREQSNVMLDIYNVLGQRVLEDNYGNMNAGRYDENINMSRFASGVYFYRVAAIGKDGQKYMAIKKLMLLK